MESIDLDMNDLFDVQGDINEDAAFPPSPTGFGDNEAPETGGNEEGEENEEGEIQSQVIKKLRDMSKGSGKKVIRNPQPKLDADRLNGDRGIPVLPKLFKESKFKGPGHEIEDLHWMMRKMEHWAHRLFPKMTFDEVIERVERLGGKKAVQTTIKKIRLDIPLLDDDFVNGEDQDEDKPAEEADNRNGFPDEVNLIDSDAENVLDEMMRDDATFTQPTTPAPKDHTSSQQNTPYGNEPTTPIISGTPQNNTTNAAASPVLTDEVKERIERNKRLALERRQARLKGITPAKTGSVSTPTTQSSQATMVNGSSSETPKKQAVEVTKQVKKDSDIPTEDEMNLFMDATMDTEENLATKSNKNATEESLHLHIEETMEVEMGCKDKNSKPLESTEKEMHLFVEPTLATESEKKNDTPCTNKSVEKDLHLFVEPTMASDAGSPQKPVEATDAGLKGWDTEDDLHLFIDETEGNELKGETETSKSKGSPSETPLNNLFVEETENSAEKSKPKSSAVENNDTEMTENELHLFLEETESVSDGKKSSPSSGLADKSDVTDVHVQKSAEDSDNDELCLCIDSTEESQEEEMDTGA